MHKAIVYFNIYPLINLTYLLRAVLQALGHSVEKIEVF